MDQVDNKIYVDEITYETLTLAIYNSYTMDFGNVEDETPFSKEQYEQIDRKYTDSSNEFIWRNDISIFISAMKWLMGREKVSDSSDTLDITRTQGLKLIELLKLGNKEINERDWL